MTRVYIDMVGDLFHRGHVEILRRARELGDELVVGVLSDEFAESYKRRPIMTLDERAAVIGSSRYVDEVVPDAPHVLTEEWLREQRIDLVVHGDDWDEETLTREFSVPMELGMLRILPHTEGISTTEIIERIRTRAP